uniref:CYP4C n=1 Tax=Eurytemora pacifica TaxID=207948 RepID=A0A6G5X3K5_9MAXI|nr:CYP4C [Eurytemora pacifica]
MLIPILFGVCIYILGTWLNIFRNRKKNMLHVPGPTPLPLLGNALLFAGPPETFLPSIRSLVEQYGPIARFHLGSRVNLAVATPEAFEKILSSNKQITKGEDYKFLDDWLAKGLLTSTGTKWHSRRKLLTPAFHFKILEDFMEVINDQSKIFCDILRTKADGPAFNVFPLVTHCALDIICETAMGKHINAQGDSDSEYVKAVYESSELVNQRQLGPWLWSDFIYRLTPAGAKWRKCISILHSFTDKVIKERKVELQNETDESLDDDGRKRKVAFLDLLIRESKGGTVLSDGDVREEVDTFMFEGHDTTATNMTFTLYLLATHPEVQKRCQEELDQIFEGSDRHADSSDLASMKYLDSCLKESLRLYQSVPIMSRRTGEDVEIDGYLIPANTNVIMLSFLLHRDEKTYPNPDKFDPERFSSNNTQKRHPYSYVPFSAGPRNCIGQKFATMEEKILISSVLRNFNLKSDLKVEDIPLLAEIILRPKNGIQVSITPRS